MFLNVHNAVSYGDGGQVFAVIESTHSDSLNTVGDNY